MAAESARHQVQEASLMPLSLTERQAVLMGVSGPVSPRAQARTDRAHRSIRCRRCVVTSLVCCAGCTPEASD